MKVLTNLSHESELTIAKLRTLCLELGNDVTSKDKLINIALETLGRMDVEQIKYYYNERA